MSRAILALWLAMHGSVVAHSCAVRLLTQYVRLPIAGAEEVGGARTNMEEFEKDAGSALRLPFMKGFGKLLNTGNNNSGGKKQTSKDDEKAKAAAKKGRSKSVVAVGDGKNRSDEAMLSADGHKKAGRHRSSLEPLKGKYIGFCEGIKLS